MARYIALDTETTGIGPTQNRITEIAAVEFEPESGRPTGNNFHTFLNPEQEIPPEVVKVHGKSWDDLKDAPLFKDVSEEFLSFVAGTEVIIHNAPFDVGFLDAELKRVGTVKLRSAVRNITDTLALSRRYCGAKVHTLDALCDRFGVDRSQRTLHGALIDCEMLAAVYPHLQSKAQEVQSKVNALLPFCLGDELPQDVDELTARYMRLEEMMKLLEADQKRYKDAVKTAVEGLPYANAEYEVTFQNRTTTDWNAVAKAHLGGISLAPFQQPGSAMYIRYR